MSDSFDKVMSVLSEHGMTIVDFLKELGQNNQSLFLLTEDDQKKFNTLFKSLKSNRASYRSSKDKGNTFERLVHIMFLNGKKPLFKITNNCRTSTNEIDLLMDWSDFARNMYCHNIYEELSGGFICECKYYNKKISVTYIGKFYSLLKTANYKIGLFFSWKGITGSSDWMDAKGLIKKIALKDDIYILDFDSNDLEKISKREKCIFNLIHDKYICLKNDINYDSYITSHENEKDFIIN